MAVPLQAATFSQLQARLLKHCPTSKSSARCIEPLITHIAVLKPPSISILIVKYPRSKKQGEEAPKVKTMEIDINGIVVGKNLQPLRWLVLRPKKSAVVVSCEVTVIQLYTLFPPYLKAF